jgi:membrane protease YdiL (CAAX protease family)
MNFTKKDYIVIFLYILIIAIEFYGIGLLNFSENISQTIRLFFIFLNAFIVLYAYRDVLSADWKTFRQDKWTKWIIIIISFIIVTCFLNFVHRFTVSSGGESVAAEVSAQSGETNDIRNMPLFSFILTVIMLFIPILSAFTEEVMFRYVLMFKHSRSKILQYTLLVLSSVAFGLIHYQARGSVAATVPYIFVGMAFGVIYLWKKNIWYNIFTHIMFNGINVLFGFVGILFQRFWG